MPGGAVAARRQPRLYTKRATSKGMRINMLTLEKEGYGQQNDRRDGNRRLINALNSDQFGPKPRNWFLASLIEVRGMWAIVKDQH